MRYTLIVVFLTLTLAGCNPAWHDIADGEVAVITPVAPGVSESDLVWWELIVESAVIRWNTALDAEGCEPPFEIGLGGHRVELVVESAWPYDGACAKTWDGMDLGGHKEFIEARAGQCASVHTVMHELGHAMGLAHAPDDMPVVMNAYATRQPFELTDYDVAQAVEALGCR